MTRSLDVRFDVYRGESKLSELIPTDAPYLMMNSSADIKTSLSGRFLPNDTVEWLHDEIRPVLILDGKEHALGVFLPTSVSEEETDAERFVSVEAYDRCWRLQACKTETIIHLASGTNYMTAIENLLVDAGIELYLKTPTTLTLATSREDWDVGSPYLDIINQLLSEINYKSVWFNAQGFAILEPESTPDASAIRHTMNAEDVKSLLLPRKTSTSDFFRKANVFICICQNPDLPAPLVSVAVNDNPQSPLSVSQRGMRISEVIKLDNIADQATLDNYAKRLVFESMAGEDTITVETALRPGHGVGDIVALAYGSSGGICIESAWSMELVSGGSMSHTLRKVVYAIEQ